MNIIRVLLGHSHLYFVKCSTRGLFNCRCSSNSTGRKSWFSTIANVYTWRAQWASFCIVIFMIESICKASFISVHASSQMLKTAYVLNWDSDRASLIAGLKYGVERWNGKWNQTVNVHSCSKLVTDAAQSRLNYLVYFLGFLSHHRSFMSKYGLPTSCFYNQAWFCR